MTESTEQTRARFEALLGPHKTAERIALLGGWSRASVFRWYDEGFPQHARLIAALLEKVPENEWPPEAKRAKNRPI